MAKVINLNRFRKRKAREEKEKRAETNRRLHGRTAAERAREEADKKRLERGLDGAFLVRERVPVGQLETDQWGTDPGRVFEQLEKMTRDVPTLEEFSQTLDSRSASVSPGDRPVDVDEGLHRPDEHSAAGSRNEASRNEGSRNEASRSEASRSEVPPDEPSPPSQED